MESTALKMNYYALMVAILTGCLPETAFIKLESNNPHRVKMRLTQTDIEDIAALRAEGVKWDVISEMYGKRRDTLHKALRNKLWRSKPNL